MRKLTESEVAELRTFKYKPNGDELYWDRMAEFYADDPETLEEIDYEKQLLLSVRQVPLGYQHYSGCIKMYLDSVDAFNEKVGYTPEPEKEYPEVLMEKIAAKFGIDIDINGDGITSFEAYRKNKKDY